MIYLSSVIRLTTEYSQSRSCVTYPLKQNANTLENECSIKTFMLFYYVQFTGGQMNLGLLFKNQI